MQNQVPSSLVIKVGGSLYDLPDLGSRLQTWLDQFCGRLVVIVPGGGAIADVVRHLDRCYRLGEERAHWLALRGLHLNAHFLASLLPGFVVGGKPGNSRKQLILDAFSFAVDDEDQPGSLPHSWSVTSDSIAARAAVVFQASELVLLKSVDDTGCFDWEKAAQNGLVDRYFPQVVRGIARVQLLNFRRWPGS
jgi:aspartokinase-like uncharacterized kinase